MKREDDIKQIIVSQTHGFLDVSKKIDMFKEIENILGGKLTIKNTVSHELSSLYIAIPYKKWEIQISESDTKPLIFQVEFEAQIDFKLIIGIEDMIEKILMKFGKREVEIGDDKFDNKYLIQSNNSEITSKLLNKNNRDKILEHKIYSISYLTEKKNRKSKLTSVISRTIDDKEKYIDLVIFHQMFIDSLTEFKIINNRC